MWVTDQSGFDKGFDRFVTIRPTRDVHPSGSRLHHRISWDLDGVQARHDDGAAEAERILATFLEERTQEPFFWFVNLTECHSPYLPPRPYNDLKLLGRLRAAEEAQRYLTLTEIWKVCLGSAKIPDAAIKRMRHLYRRSIRYMDDWLTRILEMLDAQKLLEETVVIVTSDHGENLGESDLIAHAFSLDDRLIRVPFVSSHSELFTGSGAKSLADLPRALADLAELPEHPYEDAGSYEGVAVAEMQRLLPPSDPGAQEAAKLFNLDEAGFRRMTSSAWCATDGQYKLVRTDTQEALYDLSADSFEIRPLEINHTLDPRISDRAATLRTAGEKILDRRWDGLDEASKVENGPDGAPEIPPEELEAIEAQMRRLGYL